MEISAQEALLDCRRDTGGWERYNNSDLKVAGIIRECGGGEDPWWVSKLFLANEEEQERQQDRNKTQMIIRAGAGWLNIDMTGPPQDAQSDACSVGRQ